MLCDEVENNGGEVKNVVIRTYFKMLSSYISEKLTPSPSVPLPASSFEDYFWKLLTFSHRQLKFLRILDQKFKS
jgi:hypothetical protein